MTDSPCSPSHRPAASTAFAIPGLPQIHPLHPRRWTALRLQVFLMVLDACGSVDVAARAAGMSRQSAYRLRARRPDLARLWALAERAAHGLPPVRMTQGDAK